MALSLTATIIVLMLPLFVTACGAPRTDTVTPTEESDIAIRPYLGNPSYWQFKGRPTVLLGGSDEDNLFQIHDVSAHLDKIVRAGGNYVRNTMSSRDSGNVQPFVRLPDGRFDLGRLNPVYFARVEALFRLAEQRDVIVQIELWDRFDFAREAWLKNPYRPANNINYSSEQSGLADDYPGHPMHNENPFFYSVPALRNNRLLLDYQRAQIDRLLEITLKYPNVLYTIDNETSGAEEWGAYWAEEISARAHQLGVRAYCTEMWDAWDIQDESHRRTLDHPEIYAFVEISQNNHNSSEKHWNNLQWVRTYTSPHPRPLNSVKVYGADSSRFGSDRDAEERFWRALIGGAAAVRFHRPTAGLGINATAQSHIRSARLWLKSFELTKAVPDADHGRLRERDTNEAYATFVTGEQASVYFPDGGAVRLDLRELPGPVKLRWLHPESSTWRDGGFVTGGGWVDLPTPGPGHWLAVLKLEQ